MTSFKGKANESSKPQESGYGSDDIQESLNCLSQNGRAMVKNDLPCQIDFTLWRCSQDNSLQSKKYRKKFSNCFRFGNSDEFDKLKPDAIKNIKEFLNNEGIKEVANEDIKLIHACDFDNKIANVYMPIFYDSSSDKTFVFEDDDSPNYKVGLERNLMGNIVDMYISDIYNPETNSWIEH